MSVFTRVYIESGRVCHPKAASDDSDCLIEVRPKPLENRHHSTSLAPP